MARLPPEVTSDFPYMVSLINVPFQEVATSDIGSNRFGSLARNSTDDNVNARFGETALTPEVDASSWESLTPLQNKTFDLILVDGPRIDTRENMKAWYQENFQVFEDSIMIIDDNKWHRNFSKMGRAGRCLRRGWKTFVSQRSRYSSGSPSAISFCLSRTFQKSMVHFQNPS